VGARAANAGAATEEAATEEATAAARAGAATRAGAARWWGWKVRAGARAEAARAFVHVLVPLCGRSWFDLACSGRIVDLSGKIHNVVLKVGDHEVCAATWGALRGIASSTVATIVRRVWAGLLLYSCRVRASRAPAERGDPRSRTPPLTFPLTLPPPLRR
jgi:hypothetical protein